MIYIMQSPAMILTRAGEGGDLVSWTVAERVNFGHNVMDSSDMMQSSAMISTVDETRGGP